MIMGAKHSSQCSENSSFHDFFKKEKDRVLLMNKNCCILRDLAAQAESCPGVLSSSTLGNRLDSNVRISFLPLKKIVFFQIIKLTSSLRKKKTCKKQTSMWKVSIYLFYIYKAFIFSFYYFIMLIQ